MTNLFDLERRVKDVYNRDRTDPELYEAIRQLAEKILVMKGMTRYYDETFEIAHNLATDFYLDISEGKLEVESWTKYIRLRLYSYRSQYLWDTRKDILEVDDVVDAHQFKSDLSGNFKFNEFTMCEIDDLVHYVPELVRDVYDRSVRYKRNTSEYSNLFISVICALVRSDDDNSNIGVSSSQVPYIKLLRNLIEKRVRVYLKRCSLEEVSRNTELYDLVNPFESYDGGLFNND